MVKLKYKPKTETSLKIITKTQNYSSLPHYSKGQKVYKRFSHAIIHIEILANTVQSLLTISLTWYSNHQYHINPCKF